MDRFHSWITKKRKIAMTNPQYLSDRSVDYWNRYLESWHKKHLNVAVAYGRRALRSLTGGDPLRTAILDDLGSYLYERYKWWGEMDDLEEAIELDRAALALRPEGQPDRATSLNNLANSLSTRFQQSGRREDLEESIDLHRAALALRPEGYPDRAGSLNDLANSLSTRFRQSGRGEDLEESIESFRSSSLHSFSSLFTRLRAARSWSVLARSHKHTTTLEAYGTSTLLMELILTIRPDLHSQHELIDRDGYKSLACDAMSYAISEGELSRGIELLEQGRGLLWSQLRGFRTPIDELKVKNEALAIKFDYVSRELERLATSSEEHVGDATVVNTLARGGNRSFDEMFALKRRLTMEQEQIIKEIRDIPGFVDFLRPMAFATLRAAAEEGPVIIVNTCEFRSDALVVQAGERECLCVPLDGEFYDDASTLTDQLLQTRMDFGPGSSEFNEMLRKVMKMLWDRVVCHVVQKLDELGIPKGSRIWWCPTSVLTALPFHAAGPFKDANGNDKYLLDHYISSYTPTLKSLIDARSNHQKGKLKLLHVADTELSSAQDEIDTVHSFGISTVPLVGEDSSSKSVMRSLKKARWFHLTCHGHLNSKPFLCSFKLSKDRLTLLDIVKARIPNAEFAFLSACHSAEQSPESVHDEVLHLAAAMQFCGFRSVIGTMWQLADGDGPEFSQWVYSHMSGTTNGAPRFKMAAAALRLAALKVREQKDVSTESWVNFVHIGA